MPEPALIIVSGPPASGKTTLATRLAADLRLPLLTKDRLKEILFDTLGWSDRAWSRRLGAATMELLYASVEAQLTAGCPCIVESNFRVAWAGPRFQALQARYGFRPIEIDCHAAGPVLLARFQARAAAGTRHPGHVETDDPAAWAADLLPGYYPALALGGLLLRVDTTDFAAVDYPALLNAVECEMR
ncbi:MAG: ATP-binding protein [Chloroflexota bacterium]|nr:ATP-binding protein [Chloroflexota bacterium]